MLSFLQKIHCVYRIKTVANSITILIVDDEETLCDLIKDAIEDHCPKPTSIQCCSDGEKALEILNKNHFDVLICDANIPPKKEFGFDVIKKAKELGVKFIVIFSGAEPEAHWPKVDFILDKPFSSHDFNLMCSSFMHKTK